MGRGLGVHKAFDQIGAFTGSLLVAALVAANAGALWPGLAALAVPGAMTMALLVVTRRRTPQPTDPPADPAPAEPVTGRHPAEQAGRSRTAAPRPPASFLRFAIGTALCTAGLVTFGLTSYHLVQRHLLPTAGVPVLYAAAMAAGALAALATGEAYDRFGPGTLLTLPLLVATVPALAFSDGLGSVVLGVLLWGAALGVQDSTVKALVADLVPRQRRATAYGIFAGVQGAGALIGGIATGALYEHSLAALTDAVAAAQVLAVLLLIAAVRRPAPKGSDADRNQPMVHPGR